MRRTKALLLIAAIIGCALPLQAQQNSGTFRAGEPLDIMPNTRVFGSFHFAESCSYDPVRDLYVAPNAGERGDGTENDGYVSLLNPDGTVHTLKWIGVTRDGLTLNHPLGSDIINGLLYLADRNVVRWFDMTTGEPRGSHVVENAISFNELEVAEDGTIYMSQTGTPERIYRITPDGTSSILIAGPPLDRPNGVAFDPNGNIVVVNAGNADILTFSPAGELLATEQSLDPRNDGLVILEDGTKYVSSVGVGTVARIRPGRAPELIASGIPSAASMCYDPTRERLIIPMNSWYALAVVDLRGGL